MKRHLLRFLSVLVIPLFLISCSSGEDGDSSIPSTELTVTFNLWYPDAIPIQKTVLLGTTVTPPPDPMINGHTFVTWCDNNWDPYDFTLPVTEDITIYARWVENPTVTLSSSSPASQYAMESFFEVLLGTETNDGSMGTNELYTFNSDILSYHIAVSQNYDDTLHEFNRKISITYRPQLDYENQVVHYTMEQGRMVFARDGKYLVISGDPLGDSSNPSVYYSTYGDNVDVSIRTHLESEGYGAIRITAYGQDALYVESTLERLPSGIYARD